MKVPLLRDFYLNSTAKEVINPRFYLGFLLVRISLPIF